MNCTAWTGQPNEFVKPEIDVLRRRFGLLPDPQLALAAAYYAI